MAKRGRPKRSLTEKELEDVDWVKHAPALSGLSGLRWQGATAASIGRELCSFYNEGDPKQLTCFRYLFEQLTYMTESERIPEPERLETHIFWMSKDGSDSGNFTLRGSTIPLPIIGGLQKPTDGSFHEIFPFGKGYFAGVPIAEEDLKLFRVENNDVDSTLKKIAANSIKPAKGKPGYFIVGRGSGTDKRGRKVAPVFYVGKKEAAELRALIYTSCLTTAAATFMITKTTGFNKAFADLQWSKLITGLSSTKTIICAAEGNGGFKSLMEKIRIDHGEDWVETLSNTATETVSRHKLLCHFLNKDFNALTIFGSYLFTRYISGANREPKSSTIRLCRYPDCQSPAFMWSQPDTDFRGKPRRGKAQLPNYCEHCQQLKEADRARRSRRKRKKHQGSHSKP